MNHCLDFKNLGRKYNNSKNTKNTSVPKTGSCIVYKDGEQNCLGVVHGLETESGLIAVSKLLTWSDLFASPIPKSVAASPIVFWDSENEMGVRISFKNVLRYVVPLKFSVPKNVESIESTVSKRGKTLYCFLSVNPSHKNLRFESLKSHPFTFQKMFYPKKKVKYIRSLDLFSGAGLMTCGIDMVPKATTIAAVEIDSKACKTFHFNFPDAKLFEGDVSDFLSGTLLSTKGSKVLTSKEFLNSEHNVNMVCGGSPCQPFSSMTPNFKRKVTLKPLNLFCDVVQRVRPQFVIHENVPNFMNPEPPFNSPFLILLCKLATMGYQFQVYNACMAHYGVPQRRHRNFILAAKVSVNLPGFPQPEYIYKKTTWPRFFNKYYYGTLSDNNYNITQSHKRKHCPSAEEAISDLAKIKPAEPGTPWNKPVKYKIKSKLSKYQVHARKKRKKSDVRSTKVYNHVGNMVSAESLKQHKVLDTKKPFCTVITSPTPFGSGTVNPLTSVPRLWTPREFLRAQGVPDWFVLTCGITASNKQAGNGAPSLFMSKLVRNILK